MCLMGVIWIIMIISVINNDWFGDCRHKSLGTSGLMSLKLLNVIMG